MRKIWIGMIIMLLQGCFYYQAQPRSGSGDWITSDMHKVAQYYLCTKEHYGPGSDVICQPDPAFWVTRPRFQIRDFVGAKEKYVYDNDYLMYFVIMLGERQPAKLDELVRDYYKTGATSLIDLLDNPQYTGVSKLVPEFVTMPSNSLASTTTNTPSMVRVCAQFPDLCARYQNQRTIRNTGWNTIVGTTSMAEIYARLRQFRIRKK